MANSLLPDTPKNLDYYREYCRLFISNVVLQTQYKELITEKQKLDEDLSQLDNQIKELNPIDSSEMDDKKKRHRKKAVDIERKYKCIECKKAYGSEGSLTQHIKSKHQKCEVQKDLNEKSDQNFQQDEEEQQDSEAEKDEEENDEEEEEEEEDTLQ